MAAFGIWLKKAAFMLGIGCCLGLTACAGKQGLYPQDSSMGIVLDEGCGEPLSPAELKALKSTGKIDRSLSPEAMQDIIVQYKYYLRKGRQTVAASSKRSEQYLAYTKSVFRSRGMPEELAYLAIVESGYRSEIKSPAGAVGAWQFMPFTGEKYGLRQDWWIDERKDPYKSTVAAADYLKKLHDDFGDWPTAIAAYNAGEGKIGRALQGTGAKDFFEIKARNHTLDDKAQLREETKQYVPRFMAMTKIMRNLPELGFEPISPETAPEVKRLSVQPGTDLMALARACNLSWAEFKAYNLHHKMPVSATDRISNVYVPARAEKNAIGFLGTAQATSFAGWRPMAVTAKNNSFEKISRQYRVSLERLRQVNPGIDRIKAGQIVLAPAMPERAMPVLAEVKHKIPSQKMDTPPQSLPSYRAIPSEKPRIVRGSAKAEASKKGAEIEHVLSAGETLYAVAKKYKISVAQLQSHNQIDKPESVRIGQVLRIPQPAGGIEVAREMSASGRIGQKAKKSTYTVQDRDSLWNIARKHNVSVADLKRWNHVDENNLRAGAILVVAKD